MRDAERRQVMSNAQTIGTTKLRRGKGAGVFDMIVTLTHTTADDIVLWSRQPPAYKRKPKDTLTLYGVSV